MEVGNYGYAPHSAVCLHAVVTSVCLGLFLGTEAPVMMPNGIDFFFSFFFLSACLYADMPGSSDIKLRHWPMRVIAPCMLQVIVCIKF